MKYLDNSQEMFNYTDMGSEDMSKTMVEENCHISML